MSAWLSITEAAQVLRRTEHEVRALAVNGSLTSEQRVDHLVVSATSVEAYRLRLARAERRARIPQAVFQEPVMGSLPSDPVERAERLTEWADDRHDNPDETGEQH